jgi:hypothetical protein
MMRFDDGLLLDHLRQSTVSGEPEDEAHDRYELEQAPEHAVDGIS